MTITPPRRGRPPMEREETREEVRQDAPDTPVEAVAPIRAAPRAEDPRERAARRAEELRDNRADDFDASDEFFIDPSVIPPGWDYEWKTKYIFNQENNSGMLAYRRAGWEEVPSARHPEMMPIGTDEPFVMRKGMVLMERPLEITQEARARDLRLARNQVRQKEESLKGADYLPEGFDVSDKHTKVRHSYEAMRVPDA